MVLYQFEGSCIVEANNEDEARKKFKRAKKVWELDGIIPE